MGEALLIAVLNTEIDGTFSESPRPCIVKGNEQQPKLPVWEVDYFCPGKRC